MRLSLAFFRLLCYLATGGFVALALTPQRGVSRGFFRFSTALNAGLAAGGLAAFPDAFRDSAGWAFAAAAALGALHALVLPTRPLVVLAAIAAAVGPIVDGGYLFEPRPMSGPWLWADVGAASAFASALLLGSAITAMVLGHWYLIMPALPPDPLIRLTRLYAGSVLLRAASIALVLVTLARREEHGVDRFLDRAGLIMWPRLLFGVVAPGLLALMALPTARARDTQPATGMLYVACVLVLAGEGIAHYLWVRTWVPI